MHVHRTACGRNSYCVLNISYYVRSVEDFIVLNTLIKYKYRTQSMERRQFALLIFGRLGRPRATRENVMVDRTRREYLAKYYTNRVLISIITEIKSPGFRVFHLQRTLFVREKLIGSRNPL